MGACSVCDAALAASTASPRISRTEAARDNGAPCQVVTLVRVGSLVPAVAETSARHVAVCLTFTACAQQATSSIDSVCLLFRAIGSWRSRVLPCSAAQSRVGSRQVESAVYQRAEPAVLSGAESRITQPLELGGGGRIVMQGCAVNCQSRGEKKSISRHTHPAAAQLPTAPGQDPAEKFESGALAKWVDDPRPRTFWAGSTGSGRRGDACSSRCRSWFWTRFSGRSLRLLSMGFFSTAQRWSRGPATN